MSELYDKTRLGVATYWRAKAAVRRQFNCQAIIRTQSRKLQFLIDYCFHNIKYYREIFKNAGIKPGQIKSADDLRNIPFLTKQELRNSFWDFLPRALPVCRVSRTSGSTGIPVCILSDRSSRMFNSAAVIRYRQALGIGPFAGSILTPLKTIHEPYRRKAHWTFLQGIHKTYYINPYVDSRENVVYVTQLLSNLNKPALIGITTAIRNLAYKIHDGIFPPFRPKVILTTGESLSLRTRALLESTFESQVADIYACSEAGDVAWQCHYGDGYHINADNVIVEIVENNEPVAYGRVGEVVITNLNRYAMPIIRYKNGDLAKLSQQPCPCGCKLPMIAEIIGRTGEDIFLPTGKTMPWNQLKSPMNHPQIRHFQLVQKHNGSLTIRYVAEESADTRSLQQQLLCRYRNLLGTAIEIKIEKTNQIKPAPSGKSRIVVSHYKKAHKFP